MELDILPAWLAKCSLREYKARHVVSKPCITIKHSGSQFPSISMKLIAFQQTPSACAIDNISAYCRMHVILNFTYAGKTKRMLAGMDSLGESPSSSPSMPSSLQHLFIKTLETLWDLLVIVFGAIDRP